MDMPESVPDTNVIDRKELLAQQFDELEAAPEPKAERVRSADGKYAPKYPCRSSRSSRRASSMAKSASIMEEGLP